ncbi:MAG: hypothetical protein J6X55_12895 [Victivallales bacterium]|nr:hypothetical protein [Victivallales bacterium]
MKSLELKTLEEQKIYVERLCRISFFYAHKYLVPRLPEKTIAECIRDHTPLLYHALNHTDSRPLWNDAKSMRILRKANKCAELPTEEFEETMWGFIKDYALERAEQTFLHGYVVGRAAPPSWHCGSLTYDVPSPTSNGTVVFHIANAVGPHSIFEDPDYLPKCLELLMSETELKFGSNTLTTSTWLNDRPRWLAYFPSSWKKNLSPRVKDPIPVWSVASWGQLIDSRGCVVPEREQQLRKTGKFKYQIRKSFCSFDELKRHLKHLATKRLS